MKHEYISVDAFSDNNVSKKIKLKDSSIEIALTVSEGYSKCLLHYI